MPSSGDAELTGHQTLGGDYHVLTFRQEEIARQAHAGQFVMMKAACSAAPPLRRPFSILGTDTERRTFSLFVKSIGGGSRDLVALEVGASAPCLGPLGAPFSPPPDGHEALLVAGGYGVAPLLFLADELKRDGRPARLFYGGRTAFDLALRTRIEASTLPHLLATEDGSAGHHGRVTEALERHLDRTRGPVALFACGPGPMLRAVARIAETRELTAQVSLDPWMGCGLGICLSCVVRTQSAGEERGHYRCACTEGPIFDSDVVVWEDEAESRARRKGAGK